MKQENLERAYLAILKEELIPATGCTEPVAIAYCAAKVRAMLGETPREITVEVSGNILKNVKSVVVPNTNGLRGIPAAVAAGMVAGDPDRGLQVISTVTDAQKEEIAEMIAKVPIRVSCCNSPCALDIGISASSAAHTARVRITNSHTNVVHLSCDGTVLLDEPIVAATEENLQDKSVLNVEDIVRFADSVPLASLRPVLEPQIMCNSAISQEGLRGCWGAQIGKTLLERKDADIVTRAKACAAAGSDARMSGCEMPVIILSGSGNQGITASLPVIQYSEYLGASEEQMYRAIAVSDLITVYQKTGIGRLSAYCGAISAGAGAGAGIAYLSGLGAEGVAQTLSNAVAILSGTICDGAKPSCAAKIACAVEAGLLAFQMTLHHRRFLSGDGIVGKDTAQTVKNVGILAAEGMRQTDQVILRIMTE